MKKQAIFIGILTILVISGGAFFIATKNKKIPIVETPPVVNTAPTPEPIEPSGKIDEHLTINNELRDVNFCGKTYKVKQVMIDGVDVVQRVAELATIRTGEEICSETKARTVNGGKESVENEIKLSDIAKNTVLGNEIYEMTFFGDFLINSTTGNIFIVFQKENDAKEGNVTSTKLIGRVSLVSLGTEDMDDPLLQDLPALLITENKKEAFFESAQLGISFRYPINLFVVEQKSMVFVTSILPNDPKRHSSAMMGALSLSVTEGKTIEELRKMRKEGTLSSQEAVLDGHKAVEITSVPDGYSGGTWTSLLVETKRGILEIFYLKGNPYEEMYHSVIESIHIQ